ncbi:MAG TPA: hypothetical protein VIA45_10725 [Thermoanaerobaculia bacterium]|jgi:hypothetical protein
MKKRKRAAGRKAGKSRRKPIMRHSREGVRPRNRPSKPAKRSKKAKKAKKAKKTAVRGAKPVRAKAAARKKKPARTARRPRGPAGAALEPLPDERGFGAEAGGQSGDTEGLSRDEEADSESVEELVEEGQAFEAGVVGGVEEADSELHEVRTREVPEDDVPEEYLDDDRPGR